MVIIKKSFLPMNHFTVANSKLTNAEVQDDKSQIQHHNMVMIVSGGDGWDNQQKIQTIDKQTITKIISIISITIILWSNMKRPESLVQPRQN